MLSWENRVKMHIVWTRASFKEISQLQNHIKIGNLFTNAKTFVIIITSSIPPPLKHENIKLWIQFQMFRWIMNSTLILKSPCNPFKIWYVRASWFYLCSFNFVRFLSIQLPLLSVMLYFPVSLVRVRVRAALLRRVTTSFCNIAATISTQRSMLCGVYKFILLLSLNNSSLKKNLCLPFCISHSLFEQQQHKTDYFESKTHSKVRKRNFKCEWLYVYIVRFKIKYLIYWWLALIAYRAIDTQTRQIRFSAFIFY